MTLADLESSVDRATLRENEGEAASYGIAYDDSSYDYMAHLKSFGGGADEVILIPGPKGSGVAKGMKGDRKGKGKAEDLFDLPLEVFASEREIGLDEVYSRAEGVPNELQGLQPDMDPHLRQVLEALEDEAFVDDEDGDGGWFAELVGGGERDTNGEVKKWQFNEAGVVEKLEESDTHDETWEDRFMAFQRDRAKGDELEVGDAETSEIADTLGSLTSNLSDLMVVGGKKRRGKRGPSDASGMSMSSSSNFRNEGLRLLDKQFEAVGCGHCHS